MFYMGRQPSCQSGRAGVCSGGKTGGCVRCVGIPWGGPCMHRAVMSKSASSAGNSERLSALGATEPTLPLSSAACLHRAPIRFNKVYPRCAPSAPRPSLARWQTDAIRWLSRSLLPRYFDWNIAMSETVEQAVLLTEAGTSALQHLGPWLEEDFLRCRHISAHSHGAFLTVIAVPRALSFENTLGDAEPRIPLRYVDLVVRNTCAARIGFV